MIALCKSLLVSAVVAVLLCFVCAASARADTITLNAFDSGHYYFGSSSGVILAGHDMNNKSYVLERRLVARGITTTRHYFVFDLSGVLPGSITGATLRIFNPAGGYSGPESLTVTLYDVSTPIDALMADQASVGSGPAFSIFDDLGSGSDYGSRTVSRADDNSVVSFSLNGRALTDLNSARGLFAIGGSLMTTDTQLGVFAGTGFTGYTRQLVLEARPSPVPEPATVILLGTGLAGLVTPVRGRRRERGNVGT